ncbi:copper amine oxidase, partial [bacterium]
MPSRRKFLLLGAAALVQSRVLHAAVPGLATSSQPGDDGLAKFEPATGCYIGAFIERDSAVKGNIPAFEELTKKKHASYFTYVGYGRPFPLEWVQKVVRNGGAPHIAFEPNNGLAEVVDGPYLRAWARDAARARCPIFLRWASEMNGPWTKARYGGTAETYKEKFALVSRIMKEEAPNVAMVWTPFAEPARFIPDYYPGDQWVDWVGINIYSVFVHDGDVKRPSGDEDPVAFLKFVYDLYAARKPIHISEFAATIWCKGTKQNTVDWAIEKTKRFYNALREEYPRVKSVNWFCLDTVQAGL